MRAVLGIDAAWTAHNPSGVALVAETGNGSWQCRAVAPSYGQFLALAGLTPPATFMNLPALLVRAAQDLAEGDDLALVAADIPLARTEIVGRRKADNEVSRVFGSRHCGTHSPSPIRPGPIAAQIRDGFASAGYRLATHELAERSLVETYPHPALLALMGANKRLPYKVTRAWKMVPAGERWLKFIDQFQAILGRLSAHMGGIHIALPSQRVPIAALKSVEDQIDALVCAWVGIQILEGRAVALGDGEAAIWLPTDVG